MKQYRRRKCTITSGSTVHQLDCSRRGQIHCNSMTETDTQANRVQPVWCRGGKLGPSCTMMPKHGTRRTGSTETMGTAVIPGRGTGSIWKIPI